MPLPKQPVSKQNAWHHENQYAPDSACFTAVASLAMNRGASQKTRMSVMLSKRSYVLIV